MNWNNLRSKLLSSGILLLALLHFSCVDELQSDVLAYTNDFSDGNIENIENARLMEFQGEMVIGSYHNEEVTITVPNLPAHNTLRVTIELLVHDSWDGNAVNVGGPDFWFLEIDDREILKTTFSNSPCNSLFCLYQSFPENHIRQFEPKTGAMDTDLPGLCQYKDVPNYTTKYSVTKLISHSGQRLKIVCRDELKQENAPDPKCDESWSISKIEVHALSVN